ncbi:MAG: hypothetical protein HOI89_06990 [Phycisphaerae bacterium]|jgi:cyclohexa-1,5-dienecarbonyl-CoA hydratase|nr:hypothetical protein [Phycisphaerae bacterium]MBT5657510.1 hypothetical protein [Phycisphaerae bacterium]
MNDYQYFNLDITGGVATVTMNLPPLNVMDNPMMAEFNTLLDGLVGDDSFAAIVIAAEGKAFSAGVDVSDHTEDKVGDMIERFHGIFRRLAATDAITIAAVQGAALGGGCELACFCDVVLASDRAKFGQPEVHVGVFPPVAAAILPWRVGLGKAIELVSLGATISATEAHRIGLVNQLFPADEFNDKVAAYIDSIRGLSRPVVRMAKQATMVGMRAETLKRLEEAEKIYLDELMQLHDAHEGIAAFMEKRSPEWSHA